MGATKLSKSQRRKLRKADNNLKLQQIAPLTSAQQAFFDCYDSYSVITLDGYPGTGKTLLALYKALKDVQASKYNKIYIVRSTVAVRDVGFLPGNISEKIKEFEKPYVDLCSFLYERDDAYAILKNKGQIEFICTSHLRGTTFDDSILIIDEVQNMSESELHTINTRIGEDSKVIFCGDIYQDDLTSKRYKTESGYRKMLKIWKHISSCKVITFGIDDIVRSGYVREYILAKIRADRGELTNLEQIKRTVANANSG